MQKFNLNEYVTVADRLELFLAEYPNARIVTELLQVLNADSDRPRYIVCACIYRDSDPQTLATASGLAEEQHGGAGASKTSALENAETSAIGRALANAGYSGTVGKKRAPRPSREEMQKVERVEHAQEHAQPVQPPQEQSAGGAIDIGTVLDFFTVEDGREQWQTAKKAGADTFILDAIEQRARELTNRQKQQERDAAEYAHLMDN